MIATVIVIRIYNPLSGSYTVYFRIATDLIDKLNYSQDNFLRYLKSNFKSS